MKISIFITYDFGMKGDYEGLYKWLDENNAEERGYGVARIQSFDVKEELTKDLELLRYVHDDIMKNVKIGSADRIYMIWISLEKKVLQGGFLFGKKKQSPWTGYATKNATPLNLDA